MKRVEFFGLSGAGKTTLAEYLRQNRGEYLWCESKPNKWRFRYEGVKFLLKLSWNAPRLFFRSFYDKELNALIKKLSYRLGCVNYRKNFTGVLIFHDNGIYQPFIDYIISHGIDCTQYIKPLLPLLPVPGLMIYVDLSPEAAQQRFCQRERINDIDLKDMKIRYNRSVMICHILRDYFGQKNIDVVKHDGAEMPTDQSVKEICGKISSLIQAGKVA